MYIKDLLVFFEYLFQIILLCSTHLKQQNYLIFIVNILTRQLSLISYYYQFDNIM